MNNTWPGTNIFYRPYLLPIHIVIHQLSLLISFFWQISFSQIFAFHIAKEFFKNNNEKIAFRVFSIENATKKVDISMDMVYKGLTNVKCIILRVSSYTYSAKIWNAFWFFFFLRLVTLAYIFRTYYFTIRSKKCNFTEFNFANRAQNRKNKFCKFKFRKLIIWQNFPFVKNIRYIRYKRHLTCSSHHC